MPGSPVRTLRRRKDIDYLFAVGKRIGGTSATVVAAPSPDGTSGYLFIAGRKAGGPVERNRGRRRLRAAIGRLAGRVTPGWWVAVIAKAETATVEFAKLTQELEAGLKRLGVLCEEN